MPLKILHIDDDAVMRLMVCKALERSGDGFSVDTCAVPQEFFDRLGAGGQAGGYDILLIDVNMPLMNGVDLLRKVRTGGVHTPAVFMTGQEGVDTPDRAALEPVLGVILKPFSPVRLGADLLALMR